VDSTQEIIMPTLLAILVVVALSTGCIHSTTTITVRTDGSGTIEQLTGTTAEALAQLQGMAAAFGGEEQEGPAEFFSETQARQAAEQMGARFVSGEPVKTAELEGYRAHFAFDDIRKLNLKMRPETGGALPEAPAAADDDRLAFEFERQGAVSVLTIRMPETAEDAGTQAPAGAPALEPDDPMGQQMLAMMKMMLKGLYIDLGVVVDGRIASTNAPHVDGSRVTVLQVDFDQLLSDDAALARLGNPAAADLRVLKEVPGVKIVTDPTVRIEFR
jgi:hypothetical protein